MRWLAGLALACLLSVAAAQERIESFDADLRVQPDGSLLVSETLVVHAEGERIRRGIYRDFPTRYRDNLGNRMEVDFELLGIERDGRPEPGFVERIANGVRINTGNDDLLPVPGRFTYVLRYRTTRQLGFFEGHDELYWNVTGLGWELPIQRTSATITLPQAVPADQLRTDAYTGAYGVQGRDYRVELRDDGARFEATRPLGLGQGLTVVLGFPKGLVPEPTRAQRAAWFFRDNAGVGIALFGLVGLGIFYWRRWRRFGRDPLPGPIFPQYEPPEGFSPGELRYLWRRHYDGTCFSADLVDLAVRGALDLHNPRGNDWTLKRRDTPPTPASPTPAALLGPLFSQGPELVLEAANHKPVAAARAAHVAALDRRLVPAFFVRNGGTAIWGLLTWVVYGALALLVAQGNGLPAIFLLLGLALVGHIAAGWLMMAPTPAGRKLLDRIEGLKLYLGVAERDELKSLKAPGGAAPALDARRYESLLPYALALGVEEAWTRQFTAAVGTAAAAEAARNLGWFHGNGASLSSLGAMSSSLGSGLGRSISASSSPPGTSSGGGGGGFSGGGGGGGGGGGR